MCVFLSPAPLWACVCLSCVHCEVGLGLASHRASLSFPPDQSPPFLVTVGSGGMAAQLLTDEALVSHVASLSFPEGCPSDPQPHPGPMSPPPGGSVYSEEGQQCSGVMLLSTLPPPGPGASLLPVPDIDFCQPRRTGQLGSDWFCPEGPQETQEGTRKVVV